jgi:P-type E1-E2 ATPase
MIEIAIPGRAALRIASALVDFNGTLAVDGQLIDGVAERLRELSQKIDVHVVTGDTTGTASQALHALPVGVQLLPAEGQRAGKGRAIDAMHASETVVIGNGCNDCAALEKAALSIVVVGTEGCAIDALMRAHVACDSIRDARPAVDTAPAGCDAPPLGSPRCEVSTRTGRCGNAADHNNAMTE